MQGMCLQDMAEQLIIDTTGTKEQKYLTLLPQISALISGEDDIIANMANCAAAITQTFGHLWTGFYIVRGEELVLGPFQGPIACTRIRCGKGVCGTAWQQGRTVTVPDVLEFPGHIACSSLSRSEIVVPVFSEGKVAAVLDIDSTEPRTFDKTDEYFLENICKQLIFKKERL